MNDKIVNPKLTLSSLYGKCVAETDYISSEAAFDAVYHQFCANSSDETEAALNAAIDEIKQIPAADVRPVVLCKDCLHEDCAMYHGQNWFCADGEKREG